MGTDAKFFSGEEGKRHYTILGFESARELYPDKTKEKKKKKKKKQ